MIRELCRRHTDLSESDITRLEDVARSMDVTADLTGADLFIDCPTTDPAVAIVVAQAGPRNRESLYDGSVVGAYAYRDKEPAVLRTLEVGLPTRDVLATTQEEKNVRQDVSPIKNTDGRVIGVLISEKDVTDHIQTRNSLSVLSRTTEQLMAALIDSRQGIGSLPCHDSDGIVMFDAEGISVFANEVARTIFEKIGRSGKTEGRRFSDVALGGAGFDSVLEKRQLSIPDVRVGGLVLNIKYAVMYTVMESREEKRTGVVMLIRDETDVKAKEKELILKSVAIREIHHRVKNNLQTIASLLRLQSRRIDDDSVKNAFGESISRVLSIAATHEILAQNGVDDVDIRTMLNRIRTSVADHGMLEGCEVRIRVKGDTFLCDSDMATSIALVVNEAIQNCLKYAFAGRNRGEIVIAIGKGEHFCNISIIDDGVGYTVRDVRSGTLGTRIIHSIVTDKLQGTLSTESGRGGTKVYFDFPVAPNPATPLPEALLPDEEASILPVG